MNAVHYFKDQRRCKSRLINEVRIFLVMTVQRFPFSYVKNKYHVTHQEIDKLNIFNFENIASQKY